MKHDEHLRARVLAEVKKTLVGIFDEYDGADSVCYARDEIFALFDKGGPFDPNQPTDERTHP